MPEPSRFDRAIASIDEANATDPTLVEVTFVRDGVATVRRGPKELVHAEAMCEWVRRLDPAADDVQLLAARAHHLRRWEYPRSMEPDGRAGYLRWRTEARRRHSALVQQVLEGSGYDEDEVAGVRSIVAKEGLGRGGLGPGPDGRVPPVQVHEDALCLVFLETQLLETADRLGDERTIDVLVKTIPKMSAVGQQAAIELDLGDRGTALVSAALDRLA